MLAQPVKAVCNAHRWHVPTGCEFQMEASGEIESLGVFFAVEGPGDVGVGLAGTIFVVQGHAFKSWNMSAETAGDGVGDVLANLAAGVRQTVGEEFRFRV